MGLFVTGSQQMQTVWAKRATATGCEVIALNEKGETKDELMKQQIKGGKKEEKNE